MAWKYHRKTEQFYLRIYKYYQAHQQIEIIDDIAADMDSNLNDGDAYSGKHEEEKKSRDSINRLNQEYQGQNSNLNTSPGRDHHGDNENHSNWQNLFGENIENFQHKLSDMSHKGKQHLQAFIGHIKKAPHYIVDNEYIQRGYRINFNSKSSLCKSLFMLHNESVNVWSHLIGVGCFIGLLIYTLIYLSPLASYFSISSSVPDRESMIDQGRMQVNLHSDLSSIEDFETLCDKFLNITVNTQSISALDSFELWAKAWRYEIDYHSNIQTGGMHIQDQEQSKYWHIEGYLLDIMHVISGVPYKISQESFVKSVINLVNQLSSQLNDQVINYLKQMITLIQDKASLWSEQVSSQIQKNKNSTLSDWLVLGPVIQDPVQVKFYVTKIPLFLHIAGAISCLGCSAIFHLFKDHSQHLGEFLVRLDYAGISLMIAGIWRNFYMTCQSLSCFLVFVCSLWSKFDKPQFRVLRGTLFVILGLVAVAPFTHIIQFMEPEYLPHFDSFWWVFGAFLYIFGAVIYMLRVPERFFPNKFDFFVNLQYCFMLLLQGSSHQIFHLCILAAALGHYYAALLCFHNRQYSPCPNEFIDNIE
ncbi:adiponectin receptor protein [Stylonychia lemnae]|uniref:Adiponectin receptor protein n=1 Tax=Stylonychia lemnae TaxID=5949 RepID=A0A078AP75_STYLE|nr:adiponectin receptor protein [Stylonychia lemnae]|eukprot:CDW83122.1 adiponectin receptor protein [Stylonychia lemnae]